MSRWFTPVSVTKPLRSCASTCARLLSMALLYAPSTALCAPLVNFSPKYASFDSSSLKPVCASWFSNQPPTVCPACCPAIAAGSAPNCPKLCSCKFAHSFANAVSFGFAALL